MKNSQNHLWWTSGNSTGWAENGRVFQEAKTKQAETPEASACPGTGRTSTAESGSSCIFSSDVVSALWEMRGVTEK